MKKFALLVLFLLPFFVETKAFADDSTIDWGYEDTKGLDLAEGLSFFAYPVILKNLPEILDEFKPYFLGIAFLILTVALVFGFRRATSSEEYVKLFTVVALLAIMIASTSFVMQLANNALLSLNSAMAVSTPMQLGNRMFKTAHCFQEMRVEDVSKELANEGNSKHVSNIKNPNGFTFIGNPMFFLNQMVSKIIAFVVAGIVCMTMWVCSILVVCVETIRYFLLQCGSLILPIFIAGLATERFQTQSISYIFGMLGILCWPVGLSLGHVGSVALFDAITQTLNGALIRETAAGHRIIADLSKMDNPIEYALTNGGYMAIASFGSLLTLLVLILGLVVWVVIVTLSGPFLIQKLISSGGQFFSGLVTGASQTVARAIGGSASAGMVLASNATSFSPTGERSEPSPALRMGFAGARTLMNASQFSGDPSQASRVFDTGLDEMRHHRAEAAEIDLAKQRENIREQIRKCMRAEGRLGEHEDPFAEEPESPYQKRK